MLDAMITNQYSIEDVLHYLIMYSAVNKGFKAKDFDAIRKEFLFVSFCTCDYSLEFRIPVFASPRLVRESRVADSTRWFK